MSVVAARVYKDKITMSADNITCFGWTKDTRQLSGKIYKISNELIFGGCGLAKVNSLFRSFLINHQPRDCSEESVLEMMLEFTEYYKKKFDKNSADEVFERFNALIGYKNKLFYVGYGLYISEVQEYFAIGAGEDFAKAALFLGHSTAEAVKVACELCCYVAEPIETYSIQFKKKEGGEKNELYN